MNNTLDKYVEQVLSRYRVSTTALSGVLSQTINSPDGNSPKGRARYKKMALSILDSSLGVDFRLIQDVSRSTAREAILRAYKQLKIKTDDSYNKISEHVLISTVQATEVATDEYLMQLKRDIQTGTKYLIQFAFEVDAITSSTNYNLVSALIATRESMNGTSRLLYTDKSGKKWDSERYIKSLIRSHLIAVSNESYLYTMLSHGINDFNVKNDIEDHRMNNIKFSIGFGNELLPSYQEIRKLAFHPNSDCYIL